MTDTKTHGGARKNSGRKPGPTATDAQKFIAARARKEAALADLREMEVRVRAGELMIAEEVATAISTANARIAQSLLSLPDNLERRAGLTPQQAEAAEAAIHAMMEGLADDLAALQPPTP